MKSTDKNTASTMSHRVAKNTAYLVLDSVVSRVLGFIVNMILFRRLGLFEFGLFSFAFSLPQLFLAFTDMGLEYYSIREIASKRESAGWYIGNIIPLKLAMLFVSLALTFVALLFTNDEYTRKVVFIFALYVFGRTFTTFFIAVIKGFEEMQYAAFLSILESTLAISFITFLVSKGDKALEVGTLYCISFFITLIISIAITLKITGIPRLKIDVSFWRNTLKNSWPFAASVLAALIHNNIDLVMVKYIKGTEQVGLYKPGITILASIGFIQMGIASSVYPIIPRMFIREPESLTKLFEKTFKVLTILGLPLYTGAALLAAPLLRLIFGPEAVGGAWALTILSGAYVFVNYAQFYAAFCSGTNKQKYFVYVNIISVGVNVILNMFFIPRWGISGASAATVISTGFNIVWIHFTVLKVYRKFPIGKFMIKMLACLALMSAGVYFTRNFNVAVPITSGGIIYLIALVILKPYTKDDLDLLKKAVLNKSMG